MVAVPLQWWQRGKSGLQEKGCLLTAGGGDSKESATEINRHNRQGWKGGVRAHRSSGDIACSVNPTRSKVKSRHMCILSRLAKTPLETLSNQSSR